MANGKMLSENEAPKKIIIYEDNDLVVIFKNGNSKFLFVTFGDSISLANGLSIYADPVSTKLGYSSLGFMAKERNWYPKISMTKAAHACRHIINKYSSRFLYGGSMGGYAAIKYSKLLKASHVLTCCPQWSIDPAECDGKRNGYENYYNDSLKGMGVTKDDVCGDIYVIHDPRHQVDSFHFSRFKRLKKGIMAVNAPFVRHHATSVIAGSKNIASMVDAAQDRDLSRIRFIVNKIRRKSVVRQDNLLLLASKKHPVITTKVIASLKLNSEAVSESLGNAISTLLSKKRSQELLYVISLIKQMAGNSVIYDKYIDTIKLVEKKRIIKTYHGKVLSYDPLSLSIIQLPESDITAMCHSFPIEVINYNNENILAVNLSGTYHHVLLNGFSFILEKESSNSHWFGYLIKAINVNDNVIHLKSNNIYLSALSTGQVKANRPEPKEWETFMID